MIETTDIVVAATIAAIPPTIAAIANVIIALKTQSQVREIKVATDGMKDQLVTATRGQALLEGHAEGVKDQKVKQSEKGRRLNP